MPIREAITGDLSAISHLCIKAFMLSVAPSVKDEGINTFQGVASVESLEGRMGSENTMLVYEQESHIIGFLELKQGRHLAMLFVDPDHQYQGVGKGLISAALTYARHDTITVSASLTSVSAYKTFGFELAGEASESAGLSYQPMELKLKSLKQPNEGVLAV